MFYFQFNIGDYQSHTAHLTEMEDLAYRRMLDWCYLHQKSLPVEISDIARLIRMRSHTDSIASVLREFFESTADGWVNRRVQQEIERFAEKSEKARKSAKARWDANALPPQSEGNANHKPRTTNQEPSTNVVAPKRRKQLPDDFYPDATGLNAAGQKGVDVAVELQKFRDYHASRGSVMLDWQAAWRTWVGNVRFTTATVSKQSALEARNAEVLRRYLAEKEDV
jgi:uncharacterized protein YdaU (DUF1376 family)